MNMFIRTYIYTCTHTHTHAAAVSVDYAQRGRSSSPQNM